MSASGRFLPIEAVGERLLWVSDNAYCGKVTVSY